MGNSGEYKDPGRHNPVMSLVCSWGSLFQISQSTPCVGRTVFLHAPTVQLAQEASSDKSAPFAPSYFNGEPGHDKKGNGVPLKVGCGLCLLAFGISERVAGGAG